MGDSGSLVLGFVASSLALGTSYSGKTEIGVFAPLVILGGYPGIDFDLLPLAFVVVIIGGMGSLKGAAIGSVVVGLLDNFGKALVPELSYFTLFAPMVVMLAVKPTGLYGRG